MFISNIELKFISIGKKIGKKLAKFFYWNGIEGYPPISSIKNQILYKNIKIKFKNLRKIFLIGLDLNFCFLNMSMKANKKGVFLTLTLHLFIWLPKEQCSS